MPVEVRKSMTVDLKSLAALQTITFIQQDNNLLDITVLDNGVAAQLYDMSIILVNLKRPDNTVFTHYISAIDGNKVTYTLTEDDMALPGVCEAEIKFYSRTEENKKVSTRRFNINLLKELGSVPVPESNPEVSVLRELMEEVKNSDLTPVSKTITATTDGQTYFDLVDMDYVVGKGQIKVEVDGVRQYGFTETSSNAITLAEGVPVGAKVRLILFEVETSLDSRFNAMDAKIDDKVNKLEDRNGIHVEDFTPIADGITDDGAKIKSAFELANSLKLPVVFEAGKSYKLANVENIPIKGDVDLNGAKLIIDDTVLPDKNVFLASNDAATVTFDATQLTAVQTSFKKTTKNVPQLAGYGTSYVYIEDSNVKMFIREGENASAGQNKMDFFKVNNDGDILNDLSWDFDAITLLTIHPIPNKKVKFKNGTLVSMGNSVGDTYIARGIRVERSNFEFENITHEIQTNVSAMSPVGGFFSFRNAADIKLTKMKLTPRKFHQNGSGTDIGTYEVNFNKVVGITFDEVEGMSHSSQYWGCVGNESIKDVEVINSELNRFDAHRGVHNLRLDGTTIGHHGLTLTGYGDLLIENSKIHSDKFLKMRADYGSFWNGNVKVKNVDHYPKTDFNLFSVSPQLNHDFGYSIMFGDHTVDIEDYTVHDELLTSFTTLPLMKFQFQITDIPTIREFKIADKFTFKNCKTTTGKGFTLFDYDNYHHVRAKKNMTYILRSFVSAAAIDQTIEHNVEVECDNVEFTKYPATESATAKSSIVNNSATFGADYTQDYQAIANRLLPKITLKDCGEVSASVWSLPAILTVDRCKVVRFNNQLGGGSKNEIHVKDSVMQILVPNDTVTNVARANSLKSFYTNVEFMPPTLPDGAFVTTNPKFTDMYEIIKFSGTNQMLLRGNMSGCKISSLVPVDTLKTSWADYGFTFGSNSSEQIIYRKRGTTAQRPTNPPKGFEYFDTDINGIVTWDLTNWIDHTTQLADIATAIYLEKYKIIAPEANDTGRWQRALDDLATEKGCLILANKTYTISSVLVKGTEVSIIGAGKNATKIVCTSTTGNAIETDPTTTRLYNVQFIGFSIRMPNLATGTALKVNNPNHVNIEDLWIDAGYAEASSGKGIHIHRTSESNDGYFTHIHRCRVEKMSVGIKLEGSNPGFMNAHWITETSIDNNSLYGVHLLNTTIVQIRGMNHFEINNIGIYNENSHYTVIDGNYFERQAKYDIQVVSGDGVLVKGGNRFATTAQLDSTGRAIKINAGMFHQIHDNRFVDVVPSYDISIDAGATGVSIFDNIAKNNDVAGGWSSGGVQVEDNGVNTFYRNPVKTAGGTNRVEYKGKHHFYEISFENAIPIQNTTAKIYAGAGNPEGVITATRGSLFLRTDGGVGYSVFVKESDTTNTGWRKMGQAATQADSVAADVATLKTDFNALLAKLKAANLMA